jgi:hypothetical protein
MDKLTLPSATIEHGEQHGELVITHNRSQLKATVNASTLDKWCLRMLRDELSAPATEKPEAAA